MALSLFRRLLPPPLPAPLDLQIRPAVCGEGTTLAAIRRAAILDGVGSDLSLDCRRAWADTADAQAGYAHFEKCLSDPDHLILVPSGAAPLAYVHLDLPLGYVRALFVRPAAAGQGLATHLLDRAMAEGIAWGVQQWRVDSSLRAERLYRRAGFRPERRTVAPIAGGYLLPTVRMRRP